MLTEHSVFCSLLVLRLYDLNITASASDPRLYPHLPRLHGNNAKRRPAVSSQWGVWRRACQSPLSFKVGMCGGVQMRPHSSAPPPSYRYSVPIACRHGVVTPGPRHAQQQPPRSAPRAASARARGAERAVHRTLRRPIRSARRPSGPCCLAQGDVGRERSTRAPESGPDLPAARLGCGAGW